MQLINRELLKGFVASIIKLVLPWFYIVFGFQPTEAQLGEAAAWVGAGLIFIGSLLWSWIEKKLLLNKTPPTPGTPGSTIK